MKLMIEIDKDYYELIKADVKSGNDYKPCVLIANGKQIPKGEWITVKYAKTELNCPEKSMLDFVKCPFCETIHQGRHNFCSRCGADMRGDTE